MTASARFSLVLLLSILALAPVRAAEPPTTAAVRPAAAAHGKPPRPPARKGRDTLSVDGAWKFRTDPGDIGRQNGWERAAPAAAKNTTVPSLWIAAAPGYTGIAWYWRSVEVPAAWKGQTVRLRFGAVADRAQVWLNGQDLGSHSGGDTPFVFNVTKTVQMGATNILAVRVEGEAEAGAGIWQSVELLAHDEAYIEDVFPQANAVGNLNALVRFVNTSDKSGDAEFDAQVTSADAPSRVLHKTLQNLHLTPNANETTLVISIRGKDLQIWSPAMPSLYSLHLAFRQGSDVLDTLEVPFGFREIGFQGGEITLNREPVRVASTALGSPQRIVVATTEDANHLRDTLRRVKEKGINTVFVDAPPPKLLELADETGLLVVEGTRSQSASPAEREALVLRDRAHPCILAWDLGDVDAGAAHHIRDLDPTRFLLVGPAASSRLWLPNQDESDAVAPPVGFLPPTTH